MPRTCTVCAHPERPAIDAALVSGEPYRGVVKRFGASEPAVYRHREDHVPAALVRAQEAEALAWADQRHAEPIAFAVPGTVVRTRRDDRAHRPPGVDPFADRRPAGWRPARVR